MLKKLITGALLAAGAVVAAPAVAQQEVKVGLLGSFTGPYAIWGKQYQEGVDLFLEQNKGRVGNMRVTVLTRDVGGPNPQRARQLAQELVVRDEVAVLMGLEFTPTVLAVQEVIDQAKIPFVIFNSGTSSVTRRSQMYVRPAFTQWSVSLPTAKWAAENGVKRAVIVAADFAPGHDALAAYDKGFKDAGGTIIGEVRVPMGTTDFSSYLQRVRDMNPEGVFMFMPVGPMSGGFIKAFAERGLLKQGIRLMTGAETQEFDLPAIGDAAIGVISALHYGPYLDNPQNKAFVEAYKAKYGKDAVPSIASVAAYDGMRVVARMLEATGGKRDGAKMVDAVKGMKWDSPRGPVFIDPATREIVQNIYVRRVEKVNGVLINRAFATLPAVKDPWLEMNK